MSCSVCVEKFNKLTRKPIVCPFCNFDACNACVTRYLCDSNNDVACMQCAKAWNSDFINQSFTKKFVNDTLKKHRENQLFDREIALMPMTQPLVEQEVKRRKHQQKIKEYEAEYQELIKQVNALKGKINKERNGIAYMHDLTFDEAAKEVKEKKQFVRRCAHDGCKGFLNHVWRCGVCENYTCPDCLEIKGAERDGEHVCKPENVETAKLLAKDTKPCPGCGELIHRISGCSQMWHWCGTTWNWNTGHIEKGTIHNPHFFEWQRTNGDQLQRPMGDMPCGDMPCGGMPNLRQLELRMRKFGFFALTNMNNRNLNTLVQCLEDLYHNQRHAYMVDVNADNADLRVRYMLNDIDDVHFKRLLQQREKARKKKADIEQVIAMLYTVAVEIIGGIGAAETREKVIEDLEQLDKLMLYATEGMTRIKNKYNCSVPMVNFTW